MADFDAQDFDSEDFDTGQVAWSYGGTYMSANGALRSYVVALGGPALDLDGAMAWLANVPGATAVRALREFGATSGELEGALNQAAGTSGLGMNAAMAAFLATEPTQP